MKHLQDLVPGCNKVSAVENCSLGVILLWFTLTPVWFLMAKKITGKAMMLDEIINYVQSLQRQVEVSVVLKQIPQTPI